ncbi:unnamed protein product [Closterium sp. NIES-64]|nr:unnamed protein product [Closterium sp. NIES-64]
MGTPGYMSHKATPAIDVRSFGMLVLVVITARKPIYVTEDSQINLKNWVALLVASNTIAASKTLTFIIKLRSSLQGPSSGRPRRPATAYDVTFESTQMRPLNPSKVAPLVSSTSVAAFKDPHLVAPDDLLLHLARIALALHSRAPYPPHHSQVAPLVASNTVAAFKDPHLVAPDDLLLRLARLALACTATPTASRPTMAQVVGQLQAMQQEVAGREVDLCCAHRQGDRGRCWHC